MATTYSFEDMDKAGEIEGTDIRFSNIEKTIGSNETISGMLEEVVLENKIIQEKVELEEKELKSNILNNNDIENYESQAKQLMFLLTRTHFYATNLAEIINSHWEKQKIRKEVYSTSGAATQERLTGSEDLLKDNNRKRKNTCEEFSEEVLNDCLDNLIRQKSHNERDEIKNLDLSIHPGQIEFFEGPCLKDYQLKGVEWLKCLYENAVNGILADEMGLGKTVQVIALISYLLSKKVYGPFLVIAPLSTIISWINEFQKFTPRIPTLLFHGTAIKRRELIEKFEKQQLCDYIWMYPVIITTYEISLCEKEFFLSYTWEYIIVDEAQRLKNYRCHLSKFLREIKSKNRLLLTGTPLQNNLSELWSLLNFLIPEVFNDLTAFERWVTVDELKVSETIIEKEANNKIVSKIHQILSPFVLRRLKSDVCINLPPKKEIIIYAPLTKLQWELYTSIINGEIDKYLGKQKDSNNLSKKRRCTLKVNYVELTDDDDDNGGGGGDDDYDDFRKISTCASTSSSYSLERNIYQDKKGNLFKINLKMQNPTSQLRKISNHPYLVQMPLDPLSKGILVDEDIVQKSGKMLILDLLLPKLHDGNHRVLLFSTMTMLLDLIEEYVIWRKFNYIRLDGDYHLKERSDNIYKFSTNSDIFLFLLSTRAGGLGLNLTSADTVIIFDSDWNPQIDLQAQDRCHRIGQTKPVIVYRLVTHGTVDEKIVKDADRKKKLGKLILHKNLNKENDISKMERTISLKELKTLLESKDQAKIVHTCGNVLTEKELDEILDRRESIFA